MDFLPTDDQQALQAAIRGLLERRLPLDRLDAGFDPGLWRELATTGVFQLRQPADSGGLGLGMAEAVLVFEELGRACVPGPLVASHLAAGHSPGPVTLLDPASRPWIVSHLECSVGLLILDDAGPRLASVATVRAAALPAPLDPLSPVHEIVDLPLGDLLGGAELSERWRREAATLTAALQVGLASRMTDLAVGYAGQRQQFGRVIGSFQAVKHICADMLVRVELARAALHAAAVALDEPDHPGQRRAVAGAKLLADEAANCNGRACVQVHGGMGFTWEVPVHFFLKRAWLHATEHGDAAEHAAALGDLL